MTFFGSLKDLLILCGITGSLYFSLLLADFIFSSAGVDPSTMNRYSLAILIVLMILAFIEALRPYYYFYKPNLINFFNKFKNKN
jgi:hypothetical protein